MSPKRKILFVVNVDWFFISHRLILAKSAVAEGYDVYVAGKDTGRKNEIESVGASFIDLVFERSGTNLVKEILVLQRFYSLYKGLKPDVVHHITLKPVIYGSIIARLLKIPVLNAISGLGFNFTEDKTGLSTKLMISFMRFGFKNKKMTCVFQNKDDRSAIESREILSNTSNIVMIKGAGVDLEKFSYSLPVFKEKIEIILPARLLWDKGVEEFYKAALQLKNKFEGKALFKLVGIADKDNKAGVSESQLKKWINPGYFEWLGYQKNMVDVYEKSDIVVLPSYREGMPKTLLEACAIGRPIVTTDAIGCRECVEEEVNGFKVPVKSINELSLAIEKLLKDDVIRIKMGEAGREKAILEFDEKKVIEKHIEIYKELLDVN